LVFEDLIPKVTSAEPCRRISISSEPKMFLNLSPPTFMILEIPCSPRLLPLNFTPVFADVSIHFVIHVLLKRHGGARAIIKNIAYGLHQFILARKRIVFYTVFDIVRKRNVDSLRVAIWIGVIFAWPDGRSDGGVRIRSSAFSSFVIEWECFRIGEAQPNHTGKHYEET